MQQNGPITEQLAREGRQLCSRSIAIQTPIELELRRLRRVLFGSGQRFLAVHIRRTDKASEAIANFL
eukprot:SAG11_NODE_12409_length_705_cov_0.902640_1_plen_66_part_01